MSADQREQQLQVLPPAAQAYARRLLKFSQWCTQKEEQLAQAEPSRRTDLHFDAYHQERAQAEYSIANEFFEDAAVFQEQLDAIPGAEEKRKATMLFMLHMAYASQYGRQTAHRKIPNMQFTIARDNMGEHLTDQAANLITLTFTNPDSNPQNPETISFTGRWFSLVEMNNQEFSTTLHGLAFNRFLRQAGAIIVPETTEEDPQEPFYRRALEIIRINRAIQHGSFTEEDMERMKQRKISLIDDLLTARAAQLEHREEPEFYQTIRLGYLRSEKRLPGRREDYFSLNELQVDHPRTHGRQAVVHFLPLTNDSYSLSDRARLQPKIMRFGFDYEGKKD